MDVKLKLRTFDDDDQTIPIFQEFDSNISYDEVVNNNQGGGDGDSDIFKTDELSSFIKPIPKLSDGIKAHERGEHQKAWECFKLHSSNNNPRAKFWEAFYLWNGIYVEKNCKLAVEIFEKAANQDNDEAQFYYATILLKGIEGEQDNNKSQGDMDKDSITRYLAYMTLAANNNNLDALYNLGEIYLNGKYNVEKNDEKAKQYLKLAALKEEQRSIELLDKLGIKLFESSNC